MKYFTENNIWQILRFYFSFLLLWAFFDKLFGLGIATKSENSWLNGTSPTSGFLQNAPDGIFASMFNSLSGNPVVDILFMAGLFLVGTCLLLGIGMRIACYSGTLMMLLIYLSLFPPENNPIVDEHIVYIIVFLGLSLRMKSQKFGISEKWSNIKLIKRYPILK